MISCESFVLKESGEIPTKSLGFGSAVRARARARVCVCVCEAEEASGFARVAQFSPSETFLGEIIARTKSSPPPPVRGGHHGQKLHSGFPPRQVDARGSADVCLS